MHRMYVSFAVILASMSLIAVGSTGAFFSDSETSTGNTFAAGAIDLKVDNESYYNLNKCTNVGTLEAPVWQWQGTAAYPVPGTPCTTSWNVSDLGNGLLFFNFTDIKPDDEGEDTISLHVDTNNAYACMDVSLTSNDDKSSTEPELVVPDVQEDINNTWDGELAQNIQMFWWADDGDNVYETGENGISQGVQTLYNLATTSPFSVALADSTHNVWTPNTPGPLAGGETKYIAKTWCFGTLLATPVAQDTFGHLGTNGPQARGTGFSCNGTALNNLTQTDGATLDVAFRVVQSRNNPNFTCIGTDPRKAKITVTKIVNNTHGGNNVVADFQLFVDNGVVTTPVTSAVTTFVNSGTYSVSETGVSGYVGTYGGDCNAFGEVVLNNGDDKHCTITNNDLPGNITLVKNVTGTPPLAGASTFGLTIDGSPVPNNTSVAVNSNIAHAISEIGRVGYQFVSITGSPKCPAILNGSATLDEGEAITCTITNAKNAI